MAAAAGVSVTAVSHILNEVEGKRINPETRQRVIETARRLGYAPNGHRRIGFVTNVDDLPATHGRLEGYTRALAEAGITHDPQLVVAETSDAAGGYRAALALLSATPRPTALFRFADRMAMGTCRAAAELGLSIPSDLSVIGFDDQELICDGLFPGLTTVAPPHYVRVPATGATPDAGTPTSGGAPTRRSHERAVAVRSVPMLRPRTTGSRLLPLSLPATRPGGPRIR
ncbi:LacI family DNA-binding transcriptional regulator [Streptomyces cynarae]|uniref:LacI family DNA-binding transcriptional regulator n=1 Tax=Streptomyces cynarae TaxID=2981134 RepID=UPI00406D26CC